MNKNHLLSESLGLEQDDFRAILMEIFSCLSNTPERLWPNILNHFPNILNELGLIVTEETIERATYQSYLFQIMERLAHDHHHSPTYLSEQLLLTLKNDPAIAAILGFVKIREIENLLLEPLGFKCKTLVTDGATLNKVLDGHLTPEEACEDSGLPQSRDDFQLFYYLVYANGDNGSQNTIRPTNETNQAFLDYEIRKR